VDSLKELLGFAVLTGPLWLILILLPVSLWIAVKVAKRFNAGGVRFVGGVIIFLLLIFLPFADEIVGRIYLSYLCATEAGVRIYQTVELPAEYWDEEGRAKFIKGIGALDTTVLTTYETKTKIEKYPTYHRIEKFRFRYLDKQSGEILGEVTDFHYLGGWLVQNFSPGGKGGPSCDCPALRDSKGILLSIFRPTTTQD